jgi:glycerol transport system ATP-binding protein
LAFPLRNRGWSRSKTRERVHEIATLLELTDDLGRRASGLTADAKQKISLGRGLVRPDVAAILFDEPLTVIDPHLKWLLRRKLKQIHQQLKLSLIYVTHDQVEALTFADTVVVMTQGAIAQSGTPQELFERPAHTFVGHFIGSPGMNFLDCELSDDRATSSGQPLTLDAEILQRIRAAGGRCKLGIRPEFIECSAEPGPQSMRGDVQSSQPMGTHMLISVRAANQLLWIKARGSAPVGPALWLRFPPSRTLVYAEERLVA